MNFALPSRKWWEFLMAKNKFWEAIAPTKSDKCSDRKINKKNNP
ncbi:MAG: hypothetical protein SXA11_03450 [Cyanobacteriota bacterium]|nr:hypothetical protein [Cyanobacteriota bacterium]